MEPSLIPNIHCYPVPCLSIAAGKEDRERNRGEWFQSLPAPFSDGPSIFGSTTPGQTTWSEGLKTRLWEIQTEEEWEREEGERQGKRERKRREIERERERERKRDRGRYRQTQKEREREVGERGGFLKVQRMRYPRSCGDSRSRWRVAARLCSAL